MIAGGICVVLTGLALIAVVGWPAAGVVIGGLVLLFRSS